MILIIILSIMIGFILGNYGAQSCAADNQILTKQNSSLVGLLNQQTRRFRHCSSEYKKLDDACYAYVVSTIDEHE